MNVYAVILAAGSGTRMKTGKCLPKVLHPMLGSPMIEFVVRAVSAIKPKKTVVVIGKDHQIIRESLKNWKNLEFAFQQKPLGTANALSASLGTLGDINGTVLVLNGDMPLVSAPTLKKFLSLHKKYGNSLSVASFIAKDPFAYGRILRGKDGKAVKIVESLDADKTELELKEVNSGLYAIEQSALKLIKKIKKNPKKGEYYITDLLELALKHGLRADAYTVGDESEFAGVNTLTELNSAQEILRQKAIASLIKKGVIFIDAGSTFVHPSAQIGSGTVIYPNVFIEGETSIGSGCKIYPNSRIVCSTIANNVVIKDCSIIEDSVIGESAQVGPFAHIRPGSLISSGAKIGNFVEIKNSVIGSGTKAMHLSYIGDAEVGSGVNIGAGTITCNYDGQKKHKTIIEDNVFIGSDSQLIAPVRVKMGAYVGAGSTITKDVPENSLALSRTRQENIPGWAGRRKTKGKGK